MPNRVTPLIATRAEAFINVSRRAATIRVYRVLEKIEVEGNTAAIYASVVLQVTNVASALINLSIELNLDMLVRDAVGGLRIVPTDGVNIPVDNAAGSPVNVALVAI
jgi:hypothetical protein